MSESLLENFKPHPMSPICLNPSNARMGGKILKQNRNLYRFGQDNSGEYGSKLSILKIMKLTPYEYSEEACGSIALVEARGPHTIDFDNEGKKIVLDYYVNVFSLFSGLRRFKALEIKEYLKIKFF